MQFDPTGFEPRNIPSLPTEDPRDAEITITPIRAGKRERPQLASNPKTAQARPPKLFELKRARDQPARHYHRRTATMTLSGANGHQSDRTTQSDMPILRLFQPQDASAFRALNEAWIGKHFHLEEEDHRVLSDPEQHIISKGGSIIVALVGEQIVGCCALIPAGSGIFELGKMAVAEAYQGRGVGRRLLAFTLEHARQMKAASVILASSTKLAPAVHLYEAFGFRHVASNTLPPSPYTRASVYMRLNLTSDVT